MEKQIFIDGIETVYTVSDEGVIKNSKTGRVMTINKGNVQLNVNGKGTGRSVGKIVAEAFLEKPEGTSLVNHKDGDKMNNRVDILEWITNKENSKNVWNKRRENNTTNAGKTVERKKRENIVEIDTGFLTEDEKHNEMVINHINGNKHDNRLCNLEEISHQENMLKASEETNAWGFREVGEFDEAGNMLRKFANASVAAREIGILPGSMRNTIRRNGKCHNGLSYRYLDK